MVMPKQTCPDCGAPLALESELGCLWSCGSLLNEGKVKRSDFCKLTEVKAQLKRVLTLVDWYYGGGKCLGCCTYKEDDCTPECELKRAWEIATC